MENIALRLFRVGFDTKEVADILGVNEPDALELISRQRSDELGLWSPYPAPERAFEPDRRQSLQG